MHRILEPKLFAIFRQGYSRQQFTNDLIAGVIVGIVALPLAIAFAIASGVKPEQGLYTAVVAGFVIAVLGGSRAQVSGPTGAFIVIVYGIVQKHGYDGLAVATIMAGIMLVIMGYMRMGVLLKFIPYPVAVGFTSGIALIIFSSQTRDFLGLQMEKMPADFVEKWAAFLFLNRMANVTQANFITKELRQDDEEFENGPNAIAKREVPAGVEVFEIYGPLFFGAIDQFKDAIRQLEARPKVLILRIRNVLAVDATALQTLEVEIKNAKKHGTVFVLSDVHTQPLYAMQQSGLLERIGEENVCGNIDDALNRARAILGLPPVDRPGPFVPTVAREKILESA
jgi:MFS superfamily sulfate permease-like transporter